MPRARRRSEAIKQMDGILDCLRQLGTNMGKREWVSSRRDAVAGNEILTSHHRPVGGSVECRGKRRSEVRQRETSLGLETCLKRQPRPHNTQQQQQQVEDTTALRTNYETSVRQHLTANGIWGDVMLHAQDRKQKITG